MADLTHTRCTVQRRNGDFCDAPSAEDVPFPICGRHAAELYRYVAETIGDLVRDPYFRIFNALEEVDRRQAKEEQRHSGGKPVVYYVQVGEFIKIGFTRGLARRMQVYPPNKRLLATEPGDYGLESRRHSQFAGLLAHGREWFRPDAKLIAHINALRATSGATPIEWAGVS